MSASLMLITVAAALLLLLADSDCSDHEGLAKKVAASKSGSEHDRAAVAATFML